MTKNNSEGSNMAKEPTPVKVTHKTCHGPLHTDGLELPADHFAANPNNGRDGLNSQCKACRKKTRDEVRGKSRQRIETANASRSPAQSAFDNESVALMLHNALTDNDDELMLRGAVREIIERLRGTYPTIS